MDTFRIIYGLRNESKGAILKIKTCMYTDLIDNVVIRTEINFADGSTMSIFDDSKNGVKTYDIYHYPKNNKLLRLIDCISDMHDLIKKIKNIVNNINKNENNS